MKLCGPHIKLSTVNLRGISPALLSFPGIVGRAEMETLMTGICRDLDLHPVSYPLKHKHMGPGDTAIMILEESHLALHTWPECGCAHIVLATCGDFPNEERIAQVVKDKFNTKDFGIS